MANNLDDIGYNLVLDDSGFSVTARNTAAQLKAMEAQFASTGQAVRALEQGFSNAGFGIHNWITTVAGIKFALRDSIEALTAFPRAIIETNAEIEKLQVTLKGLSTSGTEAGRAMDSVLGTKFILALEQEVPFRLSALTDTFVKLKTGGIDPMNGSMNALLNEVAKFGGTSENLKSASLAIQQMAGKGVVSLQELRQQLGQAVPGAAAAMAVGMGLSMNELTQAITKGTVASESAIKKMLAVFNIDSLGSARAQMETFGGLMEKLNTRWDLFKLDVGNEGLFDFAKQSLKEFIDLFADPKAHDFSKALGEELLDISKSLKTGLETLVEWGPQLLIIGRALAVTFAVTSLSSVFNAVGGAVKGVSTAFKEYAANAVIAQDAVAVKTLSVTEQILAADAKRIQSMVNEREIYIETIDAKIRANQALMLAEQKRIDAEAIARAEEIGLNLAANEKILASKQAQVTEMLAIQRAYEVEIAALRAAGNVGENAGAIADLKSRLAYTIDATKALQAEAAALAQRSSTMRAMQQEEKIAIGTTNERIVAIGDATKGLVKQSEAHVEAINGMSAMTRASATLKAGMIGLGAVFNAVGGWVTLLSVAITAGIAIWNRYRDAAAEAVKVAAASASIRDAIEKGKASKDDVDKSDKDIKNRRDELASLEQRLKIAKNGTTGETNLDGTANVAEDTKALQNRIDLKKQELALAIQNREEGKKQADQNEAIQKSAQFAGGYDQSQAVAESKLVASSSKENADLKAAFDEKIKTVDSKSAEYKALTEKYATDAHNLAIKHTQDEITSLKDQQAQVQAQILKGFTGPDADARAVAAGKAAQNLATLQKNAEDGLTSLIAPNTFVAGKAKAGERFHPPTDELENELGRVDAQLERAKAKLTQIKTGATEYEDIRKGVQAEVEAMLDNGQLDYITHGKNGSKTTPDATDKRVQQLIDDKTSLEIVKQATQQVESIDKQLQPAKEKLARTLDLLNAGDYSTKAGTATDAMLNRLAKMKVGSIEAADALSKLSDAQREAIKTSTAQDLADYARERLSTKDTAAAGLIQNQRDQITEQNRIETDARNKADAERLDAARKAGNDVSAIEQQLYSRQLVEAQVQAEKLKSPMQKLAESWQDTTRQMQAASTGWANTAIDDLVNVAKTGKINFGNLVDSMVNDLLKISLQKSVGGGLQAAFDGITGGFGKLIGGNGKDQSPAAGAAQGAAANGIVSFLQSPLESIGNLFTKLTGTGQTYSTTLEDNVKNLIVGQSTEATAQSSMMTLAQAAQYAAASLASIGSGSSGGGVGGILASIAGAAASAYFGGYGSATEGALASTKGVDVQGGGALFGTSAGTNTQGGYSYAAGSSAYKFADGGIMTQFGAMALRKYANGGIADSPQVAIYGEGSQNEAFVPLPDGRSIPVTMTGGSSSGSGAMPNIQVNVINQSGNSVDAQQQGAPRFDGKQMILDVVLTATSTPGSFRDQMRGNMK